MSNIGYHLRVPLSGTKDHPSSPSSEGKAQPLTPSPYEGEGRGGVSAQTGFWDGTLGYPQAAIVTMTAFTVGLLFHVRIGYRAVPDFNLLWIGMALFSALIIGVTRHWQGHRLIKWLSGTPFAITTMIAAGIVAGFGAVLPSSVWERWLRVPSIFSTWPFWMLLLLMQTNLLSVTARRCWPLNNRNLCFTTNHLGLSIILFGGVLSGVSLERVRLLVPMGQATARGETADGKVVTLPFGLSLREFHLDNFPPVLALATADKAAKGGITTTPGQKFAATGLRERIGDYRVEVKEFLPHAALVGDSWQAVSFPTAAPAARIAVYPATASQPNTSPLAEGWVSSGSVDTTNSLVSLGSDKAIVMIPPRPREYRATLGILQPTAKGQTEAAPSLQKLRVNHPVNVGAYRLYLVSYDEKMGAASEYAVIEAIRDRGLPIVYTGMYLLLAGVAMMMWHGIGGEAGAGKKEKNG